MKQKTTLPKILPQPEKPQNIPEVVYWLSGEGAGSWFHIAAINENYIVSRFSPTGVAECKGIFKQTEGKKIDLNNKITFTYLSHCAEVNIIQEKENKKLILLEKC